MIRVHIVECSPIYLAGLVDIFSRDGFAVSGARNSAADVPSWRTDVVVAGAAAVRDTVEEFTYRSARVAPVLLTIPATSDEDIERYLRAGVAGFVERTADPAAVREATRVVVKGGHHYGTAATATPAAADIERPALSPRERQVLSHIARGLTHSQIARLLDISRHTVDTYVKRIRAKRELGNKADLTRAAVLGDLCQPPLTTERQ